MCSSKFALGLEGVLLCCFRFLQASIDLKIINSNLTNSLRVAKRYQVAHSYQSPQMPKDKQSSRCSAVVSPIEEDSTDFVNRICWPIVD